MRLDWFVIIVFKRYDFGDEISHRKYIEANHLMCCIKPCLGKRETTNRVTLHLSPFIPVHFWTMHHKLHSLAEDTMMSNGV